MYRLEVCLVSLYMLRLSVGVRMKTEHLGRERAPPQVSKQMNVLNTNKGRKEGRRAGVGRGENVSMHCGGWTGPEANALVQLL